MKLLIVNYHYIRDDKPERGIYPVSLKEFSSQINEINKKYEFVSQKQVLDMIVNKALSNHDNYCLLTFDDGLKEQMGAYRILQERNIPAIFYVSTGPIVNKKVCRTHKLHYIRTIISDVDLKAHLVGRFPRYADCYADGSMLHKAISKYIYDENLSAQNKYLINFVLDMKERANFIDCLFDEYVITEERYVDDFYMNEDDITTIASSGMLGSHCMSHEPLGQMPMDKIKSELAGSKKVLSEITEQKIFSVSYPFGDSLSVTKQVVSMAEEIYLFGLTTHKGKNDYDDIVKSPLTLKRVSTSDVVNGDVLHV